MAKTIICLVRHGQTNWNKATLIQGRKDIPLNEEGKLQIHNTSKKLKKIPITWDTFLSSPLSRAYETCEILCEDLGYQNPKIIKRFNLIEREFGEADGIKITDEVYERILADNYINMETSSDISKRALKEIFEIAKLYPNNNILIATHSHFIKALFTTLDKSLTFKSLLSNGALNFIEIENGKIINFKFNV